MQAHKVFFSAGYQAVNLTLLVFQSLVLPAWLGLDVYGLGLLAILPVLLLGGVWEPIIQRFYIDGAGLGKNLWFGIGGVFLFFYVLFVSLASVFESPVEVCVLGGGFSVIYMVSIWCIAELQKSGRLKLLFGLSLVGLCSAAGSLLFSPSELSVALFFIFYFAPVFLLSVFLVFRRNAMKAERVPFAFFLYESLGAISTRVFYLAINNLLVIFVGFQSGLDKAAALKIVISLCSAVRFASPLPVGYFYSLIAGQAYSRVLRVSLVPLCAFMIAIVVSVLGIRFFDELGILYFEETYFEIRDAFISMSWGVPFYLWAPYLTIVFYRSVGPFFVFFVALVSLAVPAIIFRDHASVFVSSCVLYCLLMAAVGGFNWRLQK